MLDWRDAEHWHGCRYADTAGARLMIIPTQQRFQLLRDGAHAGWFDSNELAIAGAESIAAPTRKTLREFMEQQHASGR